MKKLHQLPLWLIAATMLFTACDKDETNHYFMGRTSTPTPIETDPRQSEAPAEAKSNLEFPAVKGGNSIVLIHRAQLNSSYYGLNYAVEWDTDKHAQRWSCYKLFENTYNGSSGDATVSRYNPSNNETLTPTSQYPNDPVLPTAYQFTVDPYKSSGFDHGHICPSADRQKSADANYQTFFLTNMQPQNNGFNAGIWSDMEDQVRKWTASFDTLYVCKGGTIDNEAYINRYLGSGANKIPVPKYFFMAVLGKKGNDFKAIAFWIDQDNHPATSPKSYATNIKTLENNTGIDFFCNLPDNIETEVENVSASQVQSDWTWLK